MSHCPSCTCQSERLSEFHARCPGETCDHAATPISWLEKRPGLCEGCTKHFHKEHRDEDFFGSVSEHTNMRLRRVG